MFGLFDFLMGFIQWGLLAVVPAGVFAFAVSNGMSFKQAGLLAGIGFALILGWNARGVVEKAGDNMALRAAIAERDRLQRHADNLSEELLAASAGIRREVDDAIYDIQRAAMAAREERGSCELTDDELDGLRRAFGYGADSREGSSTPSKLAPSVP